MYYIMILAVIAGCYFLSSLVLFKYPSLLHKKKNVQFVCRHISHRGGAGENYENTMTAFRHAVSLGTDMLELDVHLTKDNQVVVAHDNDLKRTTGTAGSISDFNFSELPSMSESVPIDFMPGIRFSQHNSTDRNYPLLESVFEAFPTLPINIDIKIPNDVLIRKVSELCKKYEREHLTVWGNFSDSTTKRCYKENKNICLLFSMRRVILLVLQFYTGLLPFMPIKETHLEIFMPNHTYSLYAKRLALPEDVSEVPNRAENGLKGDGVEKSQTTEEVQEKKPAWWSRGFASFINALLIRPALFNHLTKRGIQTYLWVMNSDEDFHLAYKSGVAGVMTDYPSKLMNFLYDNQHYLNNYKSDASCPSEHTVQDHTHRTRVRDYEECDRDSSSSDSLDTSTNVNHRNNVPYCNNHVGHDV